MKVFDEHLKGPNQLAVSRSEVSVTAADLLKVPSGAITEKGIRENVQAALLYLDSWLQGTGAVAINFLMEDAATAEIALMQLWQWIHHRAVTSDGRTITKEFVLGIVKEEVAKVHGNSNSGSGPALHTAAEILEHRITAPIDALDDFVTLEAYKHIIKKSSA